VFVLAPHGRDAAVAISILREGGISAVACSDLPSLVECIGQGAALAIIANEAIDAVNLRPLAAFLREQPAWSDLPFIVLTHRGGGPESNPALLRIAEILGNVTFLERPFHPATLASMAKVAIRSRGRQYQARAHLEELREAESRLQTALKGGHLGAWILDVERMELTASETYRAHFGRKPTEPFSYTDLVSSIHPDDLPRRQAELELSLRSGRDYRIEYRAIWPDGSTHWIDVRARCVCNSAGKVRQLVGVSADITERKTLEHERERLLVALAAERASLADLSTTLEQRVQERTAELVAATAAREQAQGQLLQSQKMETIGQLTGGVAHDFNNLLLAVIGNLEILRKRLPDEGTRMLLDNALQGAERGATLTQRMLAFARQQDLKSVPTDLVQLILGMRDLLARALGPTIHLTVSAEENLPPGQVDANQVELAVLNLAINARDAMPQGGTISIDVGRGSHLANNDFSRDAFLCIRVADTGTGMDEGTLARAIEPFFSTKPLGKGTGLGLSMVHGLAVQLGGVLELSSEVGKGTVATLWLPIASAAPTHDKPTVSESYPVRLANILVVDDDSLVRMSTVALLQDLGHSVLDAESAKRALEILETGKAIDMVLTDQAMPEMSGVELAQVIQCKYPALPVLLATGFADLPSGQNINLPRLTKPYRLAQLQAAIGQLLPPS
jgi:PAS domain S-box-containing protein